MDLFALATFRVQIGSTSVDRAPLIAMFLAILVTFVTTRIITRRIRAGSKGLKNWEVGGVHVHHQVFGVFAMIVSGGLAFAYTPDEPWISVLAAIFGAGVSLTLDEFALWLHLSDVYWTPEGRESIDAVFIAIAVTGLLAIGATPFGETGAASSAREVLVATILVNLIFTVITVLKGKPVMGVISLVVPILGVVGAIRLAKPTSVWARWRYPEGSAKLERSRKRFGPAYQARWNRWRDWIGGQPDTVQTTDAGSGSG